MKNFLLSLTALILLCNCNKTDANVWDECNEIANSCYVGVLGGPNFLSSCEDWGVKTDYDTGGLISISLGYRWYYGLRLEYEYAYRINNLHKLHYWGYSYKVRGYFRSCSYMANLIWDIPLKLWNSCLKIQPFVGAGIGYDCQHIHAHNSWIRYQRRSEDHFAWQVIAGMSYPFFCDSDFTLDYKFHKGGLHHVNNHSIGVGVVYNFRVSISPR